MSAGQFTLKCTMCGGTKFKAVSAKPGPDDPLTCSSCGTVIKLGAVKARIESEAKTAIADRLRDQLKPK
jgi:hypothetical protein